MRLIQSSLRNKGRAGSNNRHLPFQYIEELRKLIEARPANKIAYPSLSRPIPKNLIAYNTRIEIHFEHFGVIDFV